MVVSPKPHTELNVAITPRLIGFVFVQGQGPIARQDRQGQPILGTLRPAPGVAADSFRPWAASRLSILLFLCRVHANFQSISFKVVYGKTMNFRGTDPFFMSPN